MLRWVARIMTHWGGLQGGMVNQAVNEKNNMLRQAMKRRKCSRVDVNGKKATELAAR